jgi:hypothetical protein
VTSSVFFLRTQDVVINLVCTVYRDLVDLSYGDQTEWIEIGGAFNMKGTRDMRESSLLLQF